MMREDFLQQDAIDKGLDGSPHSQQLDRLLKTAADKVITNDGTIQELLEKVDKFVMDILHPSTVPGE